jgi:hypothetical protein
MTTSDKKKVVVLVLLIAVGIGGYAWQYRSNTVPAGPAEATKGAGKAVAVKPGQDAQIRIDYVTDTSSVQVGRKNLFQYRQKPAPKPPEQIRPVTQQVFPPTPVVSTPPLPPPPPPFPAFRYEGVSGVKGGKLLASITESGTTYTVREADCLKGQYCIAKLSEGQVEIEDLQLKRRQVFMRAQTQ